MNRSDVYRILTNRVFLGEAVHKGSSYPGEDDSIITHAQWDAVQAILKINPRVRINRSRNNTAPLVRGLLCVPHAAADVAGAEDGRGDPGWAAAEGGDAAGVAGALSRRMDTAARLPIVLTCAAYRRLGDARLQLSRAHPPG
jgi:hypothetical protein